MPTIAKLDRQAFRHDAGRIIFNSDAGPSYISERTQKLFLETYEGIARNAEKCGDLELRSIALGFATQLLVARVAASMHRRWSAAQGVTL